jgi:hypothetical protein
VAESTPISWTEPLSVAQALLEARIAREGKNARDLQIALQHLTRIPALVEAQLKEASSGPPKREGRTGAKITKYTVEVFNRDAMLTEHRGPGNEPFRSPRSVYSAIASFAAARPDPFDFMDLFDTLRKSLGELPDYRFRVCTRFMVAAGLLRHERRRFCAVKTGRAFEKLASDAWTSVSRMPLVPSLD